MSNAAIYDEHNEQRARFCYCGNEKHSDADVCTECENEELERAARISEAEGD